MLMTISNKVFYFLHLWQQKLIFFIIYRVIIPISFIILILTLVLLLLFNASQRLLSINITWISYCFKRISILDSWRYKSLWNSTEKITYFHHRIPLLKIFWHCKASMKITDSSIIMMSFKFFPVLLYELPFFLYKQS